MSQCIFLSPSLLIDNNFTTYIYLSDKLFPWLHSLLHSPPIHLNTPPPNTNRHECWHHSTLAYCLGWFLLVIVLSNKTMHLNYYWEKTRFSHHKVNIFPPHIRKAPLDFMLVAGYARWGGQTYIRSDILADLPPQGSLHLPCGRWNRWWELEFWIDLSLCIEGTNNCKNKGNLIFSGQNVMWLYVCVYICMCVCIWRHSKKKDMQTVRETKCGFPFPLRKNELLWPTARGH